MSNPFINSAIPSLILLLKVKPLSYHSNVTQLRDQFIVEVKLFSHALSNTEEQHHLTAAQYCLCAMIDETLLNTSWGQHSSWNQNSLVNLFFQDTWSGERFYDILQQCLQQPRQQIFLLEFLYLLLSLGFQGQYFTYDASQREELRRQTFTRIKSVLGKSSRILSNRWCDSSAILQAQQQKTLLRKLLAASASAILGLVFILNVKAYSQSHDLVMALKRVGTVSPISIFSQLRK